MNIDRLNVPLKDEIMKGFGIPAMLHHIEATLTATMFRKY